MPAPPPNGVSSTVRCRSVVCSRRSWQRRSSDACGAGPAEQALASGTRRPVSGKIVKTSMRIGAPHRSRTGRRAGRSRDPVDARHHEHHRHERARVEHEQIVGRVGLHRLDRAAHRAVALDDAGADDLVDVDLVVVDDRFGPQDRAGQRLGRLPAVHPGEATPGTDVGADATRRLPARHGRSSSREPGARRSTRSVTRLTITSPRRPWALTMRPTSSSTSVGEVDVDLDAVTRRRGAHDGADAGRRAATLADDRGRARPAPRVLRG